MYYAACLRSAVSNSILDDQKIADPLTWVLTPPGQLFGALVKKKNHLPCSRHTLLNLSRSNISPNGIPLFGKVATVTTDTTPGNEEERESGERAYHNAKIYSCI